MQHPINGTGGCSSVDLGNQPGERFWTQNGARPKDTVQTQYGRREVITFDLGAGDYMYMWISNGAGTPGAATLTYVFLTAKPRQVIAI